MGYPDNYTTTNAPDIERPFTNSDGETVSAATIDEKVKRVVAALYAANTMLAAAWSLNDHLQLDCPRDTLGGPSDTVSDWVYCAAGCGYHTLLEDFGIDVWKMELEHPAIKRTRELFEEI